MATIFDIVGINAAFRYKGQEYEVADPHYLEKVKLLEAFEKFQEERLDPSKLSELTLKDNELKRKYISLYLPTMPKDVIESFGQHTIDELFKTVTSMAADNFGAQIKKIEDQKKSGPSPLS